MSEAEIRDALRRFVLDELMQRPDYPLGDRDPLMSEGLIDSFSVALLAVFIELTFGVYVPDVELTVEAMDTIELITRRVLAGLAG